MECDARAPMRGRALKQKKKMPAVAVGAETAGKVKTKHDSTKHTSN